MRDNPAAMVARPIPPGLNLVIVGHGDVCEAMTGINPEPPSVPHVLRPGADGAFEVLGSIAPDAWPAPQN